MGGCCSSPATKPDDPVRPYSAAQNPAAQKPKPGPYYTAPAMHSTAYGYPAGAPSSYMQPSHSQPHGYPPPSMHQAHSYPGTYPGSYPPPQAGYPGYPPPVGALPPQAGGYTQQGRFGRPPFGGGMGMGGGALLGGGAGLLGGMLLGSALSPGCGDMGGGSMETMGGGMDDMGGGIEF